MIFRLDAVIAAVVWLRMTSPQDIYLDQLQAHAAAINAINKRHWFARPFYEYMSGALVWSDETNASGDMVDALRMLFHCRTQLLLEPTHREWTEYWNAARKIIPNWIGFHPSRCTPTKKLLTIIAAGEKRLADDLAEFECDPEENAG